MISKDKQIYELMNFLDYSPQTGEFTWKIDQSRKMRKGSRAGTIAKNFYVYIRVNGKSFLAHRMAFAFINGKWPTHQIDHINGKKDDNRICNLREATAQQNVANTKRRKDNTSGFKGVRPARSKGKWWANIYVNGKIKYLGTYKTPELAHQAYLNAAKSEFGEYANGN